MEKKLRGPYGPNRVRSQEKTPQVPRAFRDERFLSIGFEVKLTVFSSVIKHQH